MIAPDNFIYFIILFTIAVCAGTYLLFSYYQNRLLILNAIIFFGCAIRLCTEYLLPSLSTYEVAQTVTKYHSILGLFLAQATWFCVWFYTRPFRKWKYEDWANKIFVGLLLFFPFCCSAYQLWMRKIYYLYPEKIDGYWKFTIATDNWYTSAYFFYISSMTYLVAFTLLVDIIQNRSERLRRILLMFSFLIVPNLYFYIEMPAQWNIPSVGILYTLHVLIISWFVSDYRLFRNNFGLFTRDLFNSISDLVVSTDSQFKITNLNSPAQQLLNIRQKDFRVFLRKSTLNNTHIITQLLNRLETKKQTQSAEIQLLNKAKEIRLFAIKVAPVQNGNVLLGYTFLLTDLTEMRLKEHKLSELNTTKDRLFAIIGHDLRKPALAFRGVSSKVNYLIRRGDYDTLRQFGAQMEKAAFSLNSLLDNLLNWALQQRGILAYEPQIVPVQEATEDIQTYFQDLAHFKGIMLTFDLPQKMHVFADPNAFITIVRNLVDNAIKFTPKGGYVVISATLEAQQVIFRVTDNGIGIKSAELASIFQLKNNKSRKGTNGEAGTGLGLTLVRELVKLNKGTIKVDSEPQKGTTVEVALPVMV